MTLLDDTRQHAAILAGDVQPGDRLCKRRGVSVRVVQSITFLPDRWVRLNFRHGGRAEFRRDSLVTVERLWSL